MKSAFEQNYFVLAVTRLFIRKWTWKSPGDQARNQIDDITICRRFRNAVYQAKSYPGADCGSDHVPVICNIRTRLKKVKKGKSEPRRQKELLLDQETKEIYDINVKNRFAALAEDHNRSTWDHLKEAITKTTEEVLPERERTAKQGLMTQEIRGDMKKRQKIVDRESEEYRRLNKTMRAKYKNAKDEWRQKKCVEIEKSQRKIPTTCTKG